MALNPEEGDHVYVVPPDAVRLTPELPEGGVTETVGTLFTVTDVVYTVDGLHPLPERLTVSE